MRSIIYLAVLIFTSSIWAQFNMGINGLVLSPQGTFNKNIDGEGYGFSVSGAYHFKETPFSLGLNIGGARYGSTSRKEMLIWPVNVNITTTNNIVSIHLFGRIEQNFEQIKPYIEFLYGFNYLFTRTTVTDIEYDDIVENIASDTQFDDVALSYGITGGVMFKLYTFPKTKDCKTAPTIFLDLKVQYMLGEEAGYLKEGDLKRGMNDEILYTENRSKTDFITYQVGFVFQL